MAFVKATRSKTYIKIALQGVAGSGKTLGALMIAKGLIDDQNSGIGRMAFIDTENGSGSLYSDRFNYDVCNIDPPFEPPKFLNAFNEARDHGYGVIILDSFSHVWEGVLGIKSDLDAVPKSNTFTNWREPNKQFKSVLDAILQSPVHVICCMRRKMDHAMDKDDQGKTIVRKLGLAPVMRDNIEYEFSTIFEIDSSHLAYSDKDRTELFINKPPFRISEEIGRKIKGWLNGAVDKEVTPKDDTERLLEIFEGNNLSDVAAAYLFSKGWLGVDQPMDDLHPSIASQLLAKKDELIAKLKSMEEGK